MLGQICLMRSHETLRRPQTCSGEIPFLNHYILHFMQCNLMTHKAYCSEWELKVCVYQLGSGDQLWLQIGTIPKICTQGFLCTYFWHTFMSVLYRHTFMSVLYSRVNSVLLAKQYTRCTTDIISDITTEDTPLILFQWINISGASSE